MTAPLERVLGHLQGVTRNGGGFLARCPVHEADGNGHRPSLSVKQDGDRILIHCFGGCATDQVLAALGLEARDLFTDEPKHTKLNGSKPGLGRLVATYDYQDEAGRLLYQATRHDPKDFRARRPDGAGGWIWNLKGVRRVLFGLPDLIDRTDVYLVEGEKDALALRALGLTATTTAGGAKGWDCGQYADQLRAAGCLRVTIIPDNDDPGREYARQAAASCAAAGIAVKVLDLPGLLEHGDASDWIARGGTRNELDTLASAAPAWTPVTKDLHNETRPSTPAPVGLADADLADAVDVALEGQQIEAQGIPYLVPGIVPQLGMLGFLVAFAKVGKTTFAQSLAAAVAMGRDFLNRPTTRARVLVIAAEDPPEYVAWLARHLDVDRGRMTFYRRSILLTPSGLEAIMNTVRAGGYGLVLIASWQAVVRGLLKDGENDNASGVVIVENVKAAARATGVPWLIDAHSGKGEDQTDEADPSRAMRGASAAAGAADYTLSLRYSNGAFSTQRRLSGRGRFVSLEPTVLDFDASTSEYTVIGSTKNALAETTWRLICDTGALADEPRSAGEIAQAAGMVGDEGRPTKTHKRQVGATLAGRDGVLKSEEMRHGKKTTLYRHAPEVTA